MSRARWRAAACPLSFAVAVHADLVFDPAANKRTATLTGWTRASSRR